MKKITLLFLFILPILGMAQVDLPITFEDTASITYTFADFGGNASMIVADPTDSTNLVGQAIKNGPETWAGTVISGGGLVNPVPFSLTDTKMTVRIWSPTAGTPIRLKMENAADGGIFAETETNTTLAGEWETLEFDFGNLAAGVLNLEKVYDNVVIFFDFGTVGTGETYYFDDVMFVGGGGISKSQVDLPITFQDTAGVDYALADFGGNASMIVADPTDSTNLVGQAIKNGPETWAGTTNGGGGLASAIPFSALSTTMSVRVWSPTAGTPIRLKAEKAGEPTISVETETLTTLAGEWETLEFDFSQEAEGTAAINVENTYDKVSIFFDFGTAGTGETYYWDDVMFVEGTPEKLQVDLPITFEDTSIVDYNLSDFGGNTSMIVVDPTDAANLVGQATKNAPETWAGTTNGGSGLASAIPFTESSAVMSVRVWSPTAGTPIRLKAENAADGGISVETEVLTTVAMEWETLEFDFTQEAEGTAAINLDNTYDKVSIFFNFGTAGTGETYYWDDVLYVSGEIEKMQVDLPITFEDTLTVDYSLADFGGNASMIVVDPTDASNLVGQAIKDGPETWAGTVIGGSGLANPINFTADDTKISVRVWSPTSGTPILLKVENAADGGVFAETQVNTTVAEAWETLEFDMSAPANGVFDLANTYDKIVIFFNFGTVGTGETYYWDDMIFLGTTGLDIIKFEEIGIKVSPNPASDFITVELPETPSAQVPMFIFDGSGRMVRKQFLNNAVSRVNVSDLTSGVYYLRMNIDNQVVIQKIAVSK